MAISEVRAFLAEMTDAVLYECMSAAIERAEMTGSNFHVNMANEYYAETERRIDAAYAARPFCGCTQPYECEALTGDLVRHSVTALECI